MSELVVRRSAWRMWLTSLVATPLIVLAVDVLTERRITNSLRDLLFRPDDTQLFEFRDVVWAWAILIVAGGVAFWALRELIAPTKVVAADLSGMRLQVTAPFRKPLFVAWGDVEDIGSATVEDEGDTFPVLWIRFAEIDVGLPEPWSARWMDERTLALMGSDWETDPIDVARQLADVAIEAASAQREHFEAPIDPAPERPIASAPEVPIAPAPGAPSDHTDETET